MNDGIIITGSNSVTGAGVQGLDCYAIRNRLSLHEKLDYDSQRAALFQKKIDLLVSVVDYMIPLFDSSDCTSSKIKNALSDIVRPVLSFHVSEQDMRDVVFLNEHKLNDSEFSLQRSYARALTQYINLTVKKPLLIALDAKIEKEDLDLKIEKEDLDLEMQTALIKASSYQPRVFSSNDDQWDETLRLEKICHGNYAHSAGVSFANRRS